MPADDGFGRDDDEGLLPSRPDPPSDYPEELIEEVEARARMSTLQHDELLTQSKILEKETSPSAKEANQHSEAEPYETKHVQIYNRTVVRWQQAILLISRSAEVLANHKGQPGASWDPEGHWDVDSGKGGRQRFDPNGNPITPGEAHRFITCPSLLPPNVSTSTVVNIIGILGTLGLFFILAF